MKTIKIDKWTWKKLKEYQIRYNHKTLGNAIDAAITESNINHKIYEK